jgi:hypothetical protein
MKQNRRRTKESGRQGKSQKQEQEMEGTIECLSAYGSMKDGAGRTRNKATSAGVVHEMG